MTDQPFSLLVGSGSDSETLLSKARSKPVLLDTGTGDNTRHLELRSRQHWVDHRQVNFASLRGLPDDNKDSSRFYDGLTGLAALQRSSERIVVTPRPDLVSSLREALDQNSFTLGLEAVMELQGQNRIGLKAGLRWPGSSPHYHPIDRLYALAREVDLERDISTRMLQAAGSFAAGPISDYNASLLCIKIAETHFWQQDFTDEVHDMVSHHGCIPQQIMLVFDEAVLSSQVQQSIHKLRQLDQMGCLIGIDHFADNHTSLLLLGRCAINQVSISTSWIKSMGTRRQDLKAIRALVKLCHRLHMQVLIDQVSTENHLKVAQLIGFDRASGPLIEQMLRPA
jgi:EAL domain-containing protein (putative c-di-GMP-specific phosphodiesterase class I)